MIGRGIAKAEVVTSVVQPQSVRAAQGCRSGLCTAGTEVSCSNLVGQITSILCRIFTYVVSSQFFPHHI